MATDRLAAWRRLPHPIRWIAVAIIGGSLVVLGLVLMVLPGPGIPTLLLGLLILATEFAWAEAILHRMRRHGARIGTMVRQAGRRARRQDTPTMDA